MNNLLKSKISGLRNWLEIFNKKLNHYNPEAERITEFTDLIRDEMSTLDYDEIKNDEVGNIIGTMKGYKNEGDILLISNVEIPPNTVNNVSLRKAGLGIEKNIPGIVSSIYTGALLKRSSAMLTGNLHVCCISRSECCGYGIRYLFDHDLKGKKIKGIILSEPTNFNIYLGNKGRLEYEIIVHDSQKKKPKPNTDYEIPDYQDALLNQLNEISEALPIDTELGRSSLKIKGISYDKMPDRKHRNDLHVCVDRTFLPFEKVEYILANAKKAAHKSFNDKDIEVETLINENNITTYKGEILKEVKEYKPWKMEGHHPFVIESLKVLEENNFKPSVGYWTDTITEGSYTNGILGLPTIGFGAGDKENIKAITRLDLEKSIYGKSLIVYRHIGLPTFGWDDSEI